MFRTRTAQQLVSFLLFELGAQMNAFNLQARQTLEGVSDDGGEALFLLSGTAGRREIWTVGKTCSVARVPPSASRGTRYVIVTFM